MNIVFASYLKAAGLVFLAGGVAWLTAKILINKLPGVVTPNIELFLTVLGTALLLIAGIGKLGWQIQTWGGQSAAEGINDWLFLTLTVSGSYLVFTELFIKHLK